jgi:hypothetical protein
MDDFYRELGEDLADNDSGLLDALANSESAIQVAPQAPNVRFPTDMELADVDTNTCTLCDVKLSSLDELFNHQESNEIHRQRRVRLETSIIKKFMPGIRIISPYNQDNNGSRNRKRKGRAPGKQFLTVEEAKRLLGTDDGSSSALLDSVGFDLLKQMGWEHGTGLGKQQDGMISILEPEVYEKGSGLGASIPVPASIGRSNKDQSKLKMHFTKERFKRAKTDTP